MTAKQTERDADRAILQKLSEPFAGDVVKWRAQGKPYKRGNGQFFARVVAYVDARIVIDRLNDVLGLDWQKRISETAKGRVVCSLGITLPSGREVWRDDGAGDTQIEGEKGAISDALKRAAVNFGIGAYLYALPTPAVEVECDEKGDKIYLKGLTRESRQKLASLAQRSLDQWEADLKAMDAGDEDDTPPARNETPPPPPPPAQQRAAKAPEKQEAPKKPEPKAQDPERKPAQTRAAGGAKVRHFPAPEDRSVEGWTVWSRQILAAVKAAGNAEEIIATLQANESELAQMETESGKKARAHVVANILKRWPDAEIPTPPAEAPGERLILPLPEVQTKDAWDHWAGNLDELCKREAQSEAAVEHIAELNAKGVRLASAALQTDISATLVSLFHKREKAKAAKKGAAR